MKMKLSMFCLFLVLMLISCSTTEKTVRETPVKEINSAETIKKNEETLTVDFLSLNTYPRDNSFIIAAVTPRFQNHEEEVKYALVSAARQISIYYGAYVSYQKLIDENIIGTLQVQKVDVIYDQNLAVSFLNRLEIIGESGAHDYYAALIKMKGESVPDFPAIEMNPQSRPSWINNPPQFDGYISGVGASGQRKSVYESWEQADKFAMAEIANSISTNVLSGTASIERGGASSSASTSVIKTLTVSDVNLKGLYVISRWREPDSSTYYSLVLAKHP